MREQTERPELLEGGTARLVGFDYEAIVRQSRILLDDPEICHSMSHARSLFGEGHAAERIVEILAELD